MKSTVNISEPSNGERSEQKSLMADNSLDDSLMAGANPVKVKELPVTKRETWDHDKFDIDLLRDVEGMNTIKAGWKFTMSTIIFTFMLFNSITTIMIIVTNFKKSVPESARQKFGEMNFQVVTTVVAYFPVAFFLLLWLLFNNAFSEMTFYMYIQRGAIIDYPGSSAPRFLFTHIKTVFFLLIFVSYTGVGIYMMIYFGAGFGVIAIFCNNLFLGVGLFWYRQQSIEWKFVSISDFIQAFPDRNNGHGNMDEISLHRASELMEKLTLTEANEPSYSGYMRNFYWDHKNYGAVRRILNHLMYWGVMLGLAGLSIVYFLILGRFDTEARWKQEINPCAATCMELAYNFTEMDTSATAGQVVSDYCAPCICKCMEKLQAKDSSIFEACTDYVQPKDGGGVTHCAAANCPTQDTCGFTSFLDWAKQHKGVSGL